MGIIQRVENIDNYVKNNEGTSFLPHMGIFKPGRETTKCRVVFLSNLCQKLPNNKLTVSHNQCIMPGPSLNHKISTSVILLRFDSFMLTFDIQKAFLSIGLYPSDMDKLMFLWFRNVSKGDYTVIGYKNTKVTFGLRSSPCLLMYALHKILMQDIENDDEDMILFKRSVYNLIYMDNGAYSCNDEQSLAKAYELLKEVFEPYKFYLQQYCTNSEGLQSQIDQNLEENTPEEVKLFGMLWNRSEDVLKPLPIALNMQANTKRMVLSTINAVYDVFHIYAPVLNRARLFLQTLQANKDVGWDTILPDPVLKEWQCIVKQTRFIPSFELKRMVGNRSDSYQLIAFSDASQSIYELI